MKTIEKTNTLSQPSNKMLSHSGQFYLQQLTQACWNTASSTLWPSVILSNFEIQKAKAIIFNDIARAIDPYKEAVMFCQRVLLTKEYIGLRAGRFIPLPSAWLNHDNEKGYAGTKKWYDKLIETRISMPLYKIIYKAFAEAVLEMAEEPSHANFRYWKNYFLEKKTPMLHQLFISTIAHSQYQ